EQLQPEPSLAPGDLRTRRTLEAVQTNPGSQSLSTELFDALAPGYDEHFRVAHRRAYDDLAWEIVERLLPEQPGTLIDAGCGIGRWVPRILALGHRVIGIEQSTEMARRAADAVSDE